MLKLVITLFFGLLLVGGSLAQVPDRIKWSRGEKHSDSILVNDIAWRVINDGDIFIGAAGFNEGNGYYSVAVFIGNLSDTRFDVMPSDSSLSIWKKTDDYLNDKPPVIAQPVPAERIARSLQKRAAWSAAFAAIGSSFATQQITVTTNRGESATITMPDTAARNRAAQNAAITSARAEAAGDALVETAFKANTLFPGDKASGNIIFKAKKHEVDLFIIKIRDKEYAFLFGNTKK